MKNLRLVLMAMVFVLAAASPAFAADAAAFYGKAMGTGIGVGIAILGAGFGFGKIGSAALESMARQPEVADKVGGQMIIVAALLEGATFFGLIVCLLILFFG